MSTPCKQRTFQALIPQSSEDRNSFRHGHYAPIHLHRLCRNTGLSVAGSPNADGYNSTRRRPLRTRPTSANINISHGADASPPRQTLDKESTTVLLRRILDRPSVAIVIPLGEQVEDAS